MQENLVSIITPAYNSGNFITATIHSVLDQTYQNWELIIIDDCSTDNTKEIVTYFTDFRIKYFKNPVNSGAAVSRNWALKEAKGRWIAFLDSDDLWAPDKLEKQINFMDKNNISFSYTNYIEIDENSKETGWEVTGPKKITKCGMYNYCWPGCLTVMYDALVVRQIQIANIKKNNDYAMWLKVIKRADCYLLSENLAKYRKRSGSISNHNFTTMIKWHYMLFHDAEGMNTVTSYFMTFRNLFFGVIKKLFYVKSN